MTDNPAMAVEIGIDIGGTFTDVVARDADGRLRMAKVPSSRRDPGGAVRRVLEETLAGWGISPDALVRFVHGTTVATNAVLERRGARIGLVTTAGFEDVLEIGRQRRTDMYDVVMRAETPGFLAPGALRRGVAEEMSPEGETVVPLDVAGLEAAVDDLAAAGVEAIAVSFLFSFANPAHEQAARDLIRVRHPDLFVSISSEVDPAFREYERTAVTAFDAYVKPVLDRYLAGMERDLAAGGVTAPLQIMQSRGGTCSSVVARRKPVKLFLSGPAAGVIGGRSAGTAAGASDLITVDIGGTSCDIALIRDGRPLIRQEGVIDGYPVRVPMVDVNAIGAGGGSIAWIDRGGGLRVGPHSAGAEPGPACYGRGGEEATVTDASVVLGYIDPVYFAGGTLPLDPALAHAAVEARVARPLGLSVEDAALGIHRVLNAQMAEGIRLVSISRGIDPRGFALVGLGGGGAIHATALAGELGIPRVVVPRFPGVLSAAGLLAAPVEHEAQAAFPRPLAGLDAGGVRETIAALDATCRELMTAEGLDPAASLVRHFADVCYVGQSHHLEVPLALDAPRPLERLYEDFLAAHERVFGHATPSPARLVNLRSVHQAVTGSEDIAGPWAPSGGTPLKGTRPIRTAAEPGRLEAAVYDRTAMPAGFTFEGPAIVEQADTTTLVEPGWNGEILADGSLMLTRAEKQP